MKLQFYLVWIICFFVFEHSYGQDRLITGKVFSARDSTVLIGASVLVNGTNVGSATNQAGEFSVQIPPNFSTLDFNIVGFEKQSINITGKSYLNVYLQPADIGIEDVVITAFNQRVKKTDMIGAVTTVSPKDLKIPSSNLTTALAGRMAGMISFQTSGEPGADNASFFIRGVSSFGEGKRDPLILIDNMEVSVNDLARLQVQDIESFSLLKDATSTAVYGARGANGVILVSTKSGQQGQVQIMLNTEAALSAPTRIVETADPITFMSLYNEALLARNPSSAVFYSDDKIRNTMLGHDRVLYPQVDWMDVIMNEYAFTQRNNINLRGGNNLALYYVSGTYNKDNGLFKKNGTSNYNSNISLNTYQLKSNIDLNLTEKTKFVIRLGGTFDEYIGPIPGGSTAYNYAVKANPALFPAFYGDIPGYEYIKHTKYGNFGDNGDYLNPYAEVSKGYRESSTSNMFAQLEFNQDLSSWLDGLKYRAMFNTTRYSSMNLMRSINPYFYTAGAVNPETGLASIRLLNETQGSEFLNYNAGGLADRVIRKNVYFENTLMYSKVIDEKHAINANVYGLLRNSLHNQGTNLQASLAFRNVGLAGKFGYIYDSRYMAEFNFGYNGSERFHRDHRFGFFPSIGAAWTLSNESFFPLKNVFNMFKIRATYGMIGNDAIGSDSDRFFYLSQVNLNNSNNGVRWGEEGGNFVNGVSISRYGNNSITWETSYKTNLGLDITALNNKIELNLDVFQETRKNILMPRIDMPITMGVPVTQYANIGEAYNRGLDATVIVNHRFTPDWSIRVNGNFTFATGKYTKYEQIDYGLDYLLFEGKPINSHYGYVADRLFISDEEVANSPQQNIGGVLRGGDIKYLDLNGDGLINFMDRTPMGYPNIPEVMYGFGFSTSFKGLDFSMLFQGSARSSFMIDYTSAGVHPFVDVAVTDAFNGVSKRGVNQLLQVFADSHWSENNQDLNALAPRFSVNPLSNNTAASSWWLRNGEYLRLKQIELGYTVPNKWLEKYKVRSLRLFSTMTNPMVWSKFKDWDVELRGGGLNYPIQRVTNFGLNLNF
ncbi:SusC/RagA family TonB-linked outer membrane protein [Sphingobacterium bovistauri]|uniref:TonB-dependent receptor n=1 Tax=Sphingobacterium bovistauri TaxID=2781959 RepID=A0ABS7Z4U6_9SPHI|nr:TonB-dependent receptor [Sphingobacterium bovistauri]MCA5005188.1 TonB-dependent receptor [Sphingobacterium bovistauri]